MRMSLYTLDKHKIEDTYYLNFPKKPDPEDPATTSDGELIEWCGKEWLDAKQADRKNSQGIRVEDMLQADEKSSL